MAKIRVGLVGCGFVAELHMYAYRRVYGVDVEVKAVAARGDHVVDFARRHRIPNACRSFRELIADGELGEALLGGRQELLAALAVIQPLTMGDLAGAIQRESGKLPQGSTLVVVCSLMPPPLAGVLARLHDEGHHIFVIATSGRVREAMPPGIGMREVGGVFQRAEVLR
jgi:hypothetical protein